MEIQPEDLKIDVAYTGTIGDATCWIRVTHIPTGFVEVCGEHKSGFRNKAECLTRLIIRLERMELGYNTRYTEEIEIVPPLTRSEFSGKVWDTEDVDDWNYGCDVRLRFNSFVDKTYEGDTEIVKTRRVATHIIPAWENEYKGYNIESHIQQIVDAFPDHEYRGYIHCEGEDAGDLWRIYVLDGRVTRINPEIIWPEVN